MSGRNLRLRTQPIIVLGLSAICSAGHASDRVPEAETRRSLHEIGRCFVRGDEKLAREALRLDYSSEKLVSKGVGNPDCVKVVGAEEVHMHGETYIDILAEAMVEADFHDNALPDITKVPPLVHRPVWPTANDAARVAHMNESGISKRHGEDLIRFWLSQFGECVVRATPGLSFDLLKTTEGSAPESQAFAALVPSMSACLDTGKSLNFGRAVLRGTIAKNFYRLADAARNPSLQMMQATH